MRGSPPVFETALKRLRQPHSLRWLQRFSCRLHLGLRTFESHFDERLLLAVDLTNRKPTAKRPLAKHRKVAQDFLQRSFSYRSKSGGQLSRNFALEITGARTFSP
jgi:hypothetical protein